MNDLLKLLVNNIAHVGASNTVMLLSNAIESYRKQLLEERPIEHKALAVRLAILSDELVDCAHDYEKII